MIAYCMQTSGEQTTTTEQLMTYERHSYRLFLITHSKPASTIKTSDQAIRSNAQQPWQVSNC